MRFPLWLVCSIYVAFCSCSFNGGGMVSSSIPSSEDSTVSITPFDTIPGSEGPVTGLDFAPDLNKLLSNISRGENSSILKIWHVPTGEELKNLPNESFRDRDAVFSHNGAILALGNMTVFLLRSKDFKLRRMFDPEIYEDERVIDVDRSLFYPFAIRNVELQQKFHLVTSLAFSGDDRFLVSGHENGQINVWDVRTGRLLNTMWGTRIHGGIRDVEFSQDGKHIAACQDNDRLMIWSFPACKGYTIKGYGGPINALSFDPAGGNLSSAGGDGKIRIWEVGSGKLLRTLEGHEKGILSVGFSEDGSLLASAGKDKTVRIWSPQTGRQIAVLKGHKKQVNDVAFNSNTSILASAGDDGTILLWDISGLGIADLMKRVPVPVYPPNLECSVRFMDETGDGALDPGERGRIVIEVSNTGRDAAYNIVSLISPNSICEGITLENTEIIPMILPGRSVRIETLAKRIDASGDCRAVYSVKLFEFNGYHILSPLVFEIGYPM